MFVNIDENFFINKELTQKKIKKCIIFVCNQTNSSKSIINNAYKLNNLKKIYFPKKINKKNIDIVIKTKFNKDYKYVNLNKSKIFFKENKKIRSTLKKINDFELNKIKFFPKTNLLNKNISQNLARGTNYIPKNLSEFNKNLLINIAHVIKILSSRNITKIKINNYLFNKKFHNKVDVLNSKIINKFLKLLKKHKNKEINLALTHGDFKFEHLFLIKGRLEYVIDWESVGIRSIFFDLMNFFIPWFVRRKYSYSQIKKYILNFVRIYIPIMQNEINKNYDIYFSIYALERYSRIQDQRTSKFSTKEARIRYNNLFKRFNSITEI